MDPHESTGGYCCDVTREEGEGEEDVDEDEKQTEKEDKTLREEIIALYNKGQKRPPFVRR